MRQAGRSLPEYLAARGTTAMLDACLTPELASEITLQPVRRHGVDVRRETFQHIEVEVVVTGGEGQQHHVPELIISTIVRHNL